MIADPTVAGPQASADKAALLARRCGAEIELLVCQRCREVEELAQGQDQLSQMLESLAAPIAADGVKVQTTLVHGESLHRTLIEHVRSRRVDWVVKGTHPHRLPTRVFSRSTDWHLINDCPVPLLLTKSRPWTRTPVVLAAIDPATGDLESARLNPTIVDTASRITRLLQGTLHVVHAYRHASNVKSSSIVGGDAGWPPPESPVEAGCEEREQRFAQVSEFVRCCRARPQELHVDMGSVASFLPRVALQVNADLLVIGAGAPGSAFPLLHDGLAARMLDLLPCDLLALKDRISL